MGFINKTKIKMTSRPVVSVYKSDAPKEVSGSAAMPGVFSAPIRNDLVHFVHMNLAKNRRQGHAVFHEAGQEHSAESWGTGRAVARIPRIGGSGTSRSGQNGTEGLISLKEDTPSPPLLLPLQSLLLLWPEVITSTTSQNSHLLSTTWLNQIPNPSSLSSTVLEPEKTSPRLDHQDLLDQDTEDIETPNTS